MAERVKIRTGTRLQAALDGPLGTDPEFNMICTFHKTLDESSFLMSVPMRSGKPLELDEAQKLLLAYGSGAGRTVIAAYPDDLVQEGIHRYWKMRRVTLQHQFFERVEERLKVTLRLSYWQDTWPASTDGRVVPEDGLSLDISAGGLAFFLRHDFAVGEVCTLSLPRIGSNPEGQAIENLVGVVCWSREAPKGSPYRFLSGIQFRFAETAEKQATSAYVANLKKKYVL